VDQTAPNLFCSTGNGIKKGHLRSLDIIIRSRDIRNQSRKFSYIVSNFGHFLLSQILRRQCPSKLIIPT